MDICLKKISAFTTNIVYNFINNYMNMKFDKQVNFYLSESWKSAAAGTAGAAILGIGTLLNPTAQNMNNRKQSAEISHPSTNSVYSTNSINSINPNNLTNSTFIPPKGAPRGIRNNNPGNIEKKPNNPDPWEGTDKTGTDSRFETFKSPEWGIRAIGRILITYEKKYKLNTISGIINRWAPPKENDTPRYIKNMVIITGIPKDQKLNLSTNRENMKKILKGIIRCENSFTYPDEIIEKALELIYQ
jgi:hypothetical protein